MEGGPGRVRGGALSLVMACETRKADATALSLSAASPDVELIVQAIMVLIYQTDSSLPKFDLKRCLTSFGNEQYLKGSQHH